MCDNAAKHRSARMLEILAYLSRRLFPRFRRSALDSSFLAHGLKTYCLALGAQHIAPIYPLRGVKRLRSAPNA